MPCVANVFRPVVLLVSFSASAASRPASALARSLAYRRPVTPTPLVSSESNVCSAVSLKPSPTTAPRSIAMPASASASVRARRTVCLPTKRESPSRSNSFVFAMTYRTSSSERPAIDDPAGTSKRTGWPSLNVLPNSEKS